MLDYLKCLPQFLVPHHLLTRILGQLASTKKTYIKNLFIRFFIWAYGVEMREALEENSQEYATFNDFFIRRLKPDVRPVDSQPNAIVSPADGTISQLGKIENDQLLQAKGHYFNLHELLGGDSDHTHTFLNGNFATFYLSPKDYHRVHMPLGGTLREMIYIPGKLFSVSHSAAQVIPNLFSRNERLICLFDTAAGPMAVILIGAMIVGSIHTVWRGAITPPHKNTIQRWDYSQSPDATTRLQTGDELGHFQLGSSVIIIFAKNRLKWHNSLGNQQSIKMGELLGTFL